MYSATIKTSLKNAYDCNQGGAKFNNSAMLNCGLASLVNSLMAVKKSVADFEISYTVVSVGADIFFKTRCRNTKLKNGAYIVGAGCSVE